MKNAWDVTQGGLSVTTSTGDGVTIFARKPNLFDGILYFDNKYLIIQFEKKIRCYQLKESSKKIDIELDGITTSINGERIDLSALPSKIKTKITREKL